MQGRTKVIQMYTILVNEENELITTVKERIMQRSKLVDNLTFLVDSNYKGVDMSDTTVLLEYLLPVSKSYESEILVLSEERYKDRFLQYQLPFDTKLTSEAGEIKMHLTLAKTELDASGNGIQRVRKTDETTIEIIPIAAWADIIPDNALSALDQRLIKLDAQMRGLNEYMDVVDRNMVDDLKYDDGNETLQLTAKGVGIGTKIPIKDMLDEGSPVVDLNSTTEEGADDEHDSVIEF